MPEQNWRKKLNILEADGDGHHDHSHVHFDPEQVEAHNLEIQFKYSENRVDIHLGFLKINHHYEVKFCIKDQLGEDVECDHAKIKEVKPTEDGEGHEFLIHYHAHKEKLIQEAFEVRSVENKDKMINLVIHARVLGKLKGTPALKNGIKLLRVEYDEDSDALSDWQGFK